MVSAQWTGAPFFDKSMHLNSTSRPFIKFDPDPAVVAWAPLLGLIEGAYCQRVEECCRSEDIVQLTCCRLRRLPAVMKGGDIPAIRWQFVRPGGGLSAVGVVRPDAGQSHDFHSVEHGLVPGSPVLVTVLAIAAQDVQVASRQNAVAFLFAMNADKSETM